MVRRSLSYALNPVIVDIGVAALVLAAVSVPFVVPWSDDGQQATWWGFVFGAGTAIPLIWRRRTPVTVALVVAAFTVASVVHDSPGQPMQYGTVVAVYTVALLAQRWQRLLVLGGWVLGVVVVTSLDGEPAGPGDVFAVLVVVIAYGVGLLVRDRPERLTAVEERTRRLQAERQMAVERATTQERDRIAKEMHDILAHAVSLMVVQAEAGPLAVRADPDRAVASFDAIAASGRDAIGQLQRMLGAMDASESDGAPLSPQPTLADLPSVVERVRDAGVDVELVTTGEPRALPPDVDAAALRIVQESLTNVIKHANATVVTVTIEWRDDDVVLSVADNGRGPDSGTSNGRGLIGIRARAAACGGVADTGVGPGGRGFVVRAQLPAAEPEKGQL